MLIVICYFLSSLRLLSPLRPLNFNVMMLIWHFEESWLNLNKDALPLANALNMNEESPNECIKIQMQYT